MPFKQKQGFTLIELLVVIVIIGILATLASISVSKIREKANDTKRVSDVKQIQHALDLYANDNGVYPMFGFAPGQFAPGYPLTNSDGSVTYMKKVPNYGPKTGTCAQPEYIYAQGVGGLSYTLSYCVGNPVYEISPGTCIARPGIICSPQAVCANNDITKPCCATAVVGDQCDGGYIFATGYTINTVNYKLIIYQRNQALVGLDEWDVDTTNDTTATNDIDGLENTNKLITADFGAAVCYNLVSGAYDDWYMPATNELLAFANSSVVQSWSGGWASTQFSVANGKAIRPGKFEANDPKGNSSRVNCIRRIQ